MNRWRSFLLQILFLGLGLVFLYLAFRGIDLRSFFSGYRDVGWHWVVLSMVVGALSHWLRGVRWRLLLERTSSYRLPTRDAFFAVMAGYFFNILFPRAGEVIRCTLVGRLHRIPIIYLFGTVLAERIVDMLLLVVLIGVTLGFQWELLGPFVQSRVLLPMLSGIRGGGVVGIGLAVGVFLIVVVAVVVVLLVWSRRSFRMRRWLVRVRRALRQFRYGLATVIRLPLRVQVVFWLETVLIWLAYVLMTYLPARGFPPTSGFTVEETLGVFVYGALGIVAPVQGGLGTYHWLVLQAMLLYGYTKAVGLQLATLIHTSQLLMITLLGGIAWLWLSLRISRHR